MKMYLHTSRIYMLHINVMILLDDRIIDDNKMSGPHLQNLNVCMDLVYMSLSYHVMEC